MATVKISELPAITGANTAATDVIPIVDVSGNVTSKITREEFFKNIQTDVEVADKIIHTSDNNTTIRFPAADTVSIETDGLERLRVTSTGNVGIGNTSPSVRLDVVGDVEVTGVIFRRQAAQISKTGTTTLTIAELLNGIIQNTGAAATFTLPTGALIEAGLPSPFPVDMSFDFTLVNTGTGTITLGTATGLTLVGTMTTAINTATLFRVRKTATDAYTVYRLA